MIYNQSRILVEEFYKMCVLISYKTSNTQTDIEKMPYYVFNNFIVFLDEITKEENKTSKNNTETNEENSTQNIFNQSKNMLNQHTKSAKLFGK